ncbi:MAG: DUF3616 domain-containing protein [Pseudomonadota bacterium]
MTQPPSETLKAETLSLHFRQGSIEASAEAAKAPFHHDLSGIAGKGRRLWLASDELACLDQVTLQPDGSFGEHRRFRLHDYLELASADSEVDLESLAVEGETLWLLGSHARTRQKPKLESFDPEQALARLATLKENNERQLLACLPLVENGPGLWEPRPPSGGSKPGARAKIAGKGSRLLRQLRKDDHLAPFVALPAKENGLDIEGLAASQGTLYLGFRGPVIGGWAVILTLQPKPPEEGRIRLETLRSEGERYLKHFIQLDGLGIRDLTCHGEDLLILAGPALDHDGPFRIYRWPGALSGARPTLVERAKLERLIDLPAPEGCDRAEGLAVIEQGGRRGLAVVHDNPCPARLEASAGDLCLDFYPLPEALRPGP